MSGGSRLPGTSASEVTIGLLYDARSPYDLKVVSGVAAYLSEHRHLAVSLDGEAATRRRQAAHAAPVSGIIADLNSRAIARAARAARVPVVGFGGASARLTARVPSFLANNAQISRLAAEHLIASGLTRFAFCGYADARAHAWSREREQAFVAHLRARGCDAAIIRVPAHGASADLAHVPALLAWLETLATPVGIMAANDALGRQLLHACRRAHRRVPDDVAVIGVDNDDVQCGLSSPPLTSIEQGAKGIGYAAARLLDRILRGEPADGTSFRVDPLAVVARRSSAPGSAVDPDVAAALTFIHAHLDRRLTVTAVVGATRSSRWQLEARFRRALRQSIARTIRTTRLGRVRDLIADTDLPLKQVAARGGFRSVQHMTTAFVRTYGRPPARYRKNL